MTPLIRLGPWAPRGHLLQWAVSILCLGAAVLPNASAEKKFSNRLIREKSPYLQQHADNPVDWYPWGEEAFQKARKDNKPIFLSIGYSTCHWCHVMEEESFTDAKIAESMNRHFINIKVDREERPDVDKIYMTAVQAMTGSGGWPLSVWLTPDLKPFFGGTYFPPDARWGRPGFGQILEGIAGAWKKEPAKLTASGKELTLALERFLAVESKAIRLNPEILEKAAGSFQGTYDAEQGGFGSAPKFPMPVTHNFLLRESARSGNAKALEMSLQTLRKMARGGIYDHIGGGFHRYSTDERWHLPHFEKMLYDNAQIAVNYLEARQITNDPFFARVARETLDYVLRDMAHPQGGFYSAQDADSYAADRKPGDRKKQEGAFYVWKQSEILEHLEKEAGEIFSYHFGIEKNGNVSRDSHGEFENQNVLYAAHTLSETAGKFGKTEPETDRLLLESRKKLLLARARRPRPHLDDKILTAWNGLMLSALAKGSQILNEPRYLEAAGKAAHFLKERLYEPKTKVLYRRWREGERKVPGIADDYAFLTQGLLDLYEASFELRWLQWAMELAERQQELFYDPREGGFYLTAEDHDQNLLLRFKEEADNVEPSASSIAALNLLRLAQFTDRKDFQQAAEKTLRLFAGQMQNRPGSMAQMLAALCFYLSKPKQLILAGRPGTEETLAMLEEVNRRFIPHKILLLAEGGESQRWFSQRLPFVEGIVPIAQKTTAYVCVNYACELPTDDLQVLRQILDGKSKLEKQR